MHALKIGLEFLGVIAVLVVILAIIFCVEKDYEGGGNPFE